MEKILNSKPTKAGNIALEMWNDQMCPISVTEIIAKSSIDPKDLDSNDIKVMRLQDQEN